MVPVSLAVNNETAPKVNNRPRVGVRHGTADEVIALRLARSTARAIRLQIMCLRAGAQSTYRSQSVRRNGIDRLRQRARRGDIR